MSPDLPAWVCYFVVLFFGTVAAYIQVRRRIGPARGAWTVAATWRLFSLYWILPLVLFWLLDRLGAVADTSFFAAVLVGAGYERIMTSGMNGITAPGEVSSVWQPLLAYADRITAEIRERLQARQDAFERNIAKVVIGNPEYRQALERWMHDIVDVPPALVAAYNAVRADTALPAHTRDLRSIMLQLKMIGLRFNESGRLRREGVIGYGAFMVTKLSQLWRGTRFVLGGYMLVIVLISVGTLAVMESGPGPDEPIDRLRVHYNVWRLGKPGISARDLARTESNIEDLLQERHSTRKSVLHELGEQLRMPGLPMDRVDAALRLMIAQTEDDPARLAETALPILPALAHPNVDVRRRVQAALVYMARRTGTAIADELGSWEPSDGNSMVEIAGYVEAWRRYWEAGAPRS